MYVSGQKLPKKWILITKTAALLNHQQTISDTNDHFLDSVEYIRKNNNELKFIVSEVGNAIVKGDTRPSPQLSGSLGTSVWTVDWMLYSMTMVRHFPSHWLPKSRQISYTDDKLRTLLACTCSKADTLPLLLGNL